MDRSKWFFHPILILVVSILALGTSLILYIYWYIEVSVGLKSVVRRFNLDAGKVLTAQTWVVILVLTILVGLILLGLLTIFVYSQKMVQLYRLQHNFINNFTHELKTPTTSLRLYLETFQKHELGRADQLKYIEFMLSDVNRLSDNVTRILNLARIESKSFTGDFSCLPEGKHYCHVNPSLFDILLMNLLTNAAKYNASERPEIHITLEPRSNRLRILFRDNGIGFDRRERNKIFKKFYQVGRSEDMSAKGSGIGLFLAQSIAKIHKGRLKASSDGPGSGAVFTLTLPLHKGRSSAA
ncbi:MAG: HAMP domain-containing sensor histidine kinase [Desulfobacteraceae bacterium]